LHCEGKKEAEEGRKVIMGNFSCKDCKPPKRNPYCHTNCPEYLAEKAEHEKIKAAADRKKALDCNLDGQMWSGVNRAKRRMKVMK
jgi:hypothetical protein